MNNSVLVLGYFGYHNNQLDGQTVKTRNIYNLLKSKEEEINYNIDYFDTQILKKNKFRFLQMLAKICSKNVLIYVPAHNNLKYFFPLIFILAKLTNKKIHYVVVGGWLAGFIKKKPLHIKMLRNIEGIYPQTKELCSDLKKLYGFQNVHQLNNFRLTNKFNHFSRHLSNEAINLVFMARIHPQKGVGVIFKLAEKLKNKNLAPVNIFLYGPIFAPYKSEFEKHLSCFDNVKYEGVIIEEEVHATLSTYDLMLFPTKFFTEGFPGSVLDAYIAGVPVVATRWKYAEEFVEDNVCGVLSDFNDDDHFIKTVMELIASPTRLKALRKGVENQAKKYSPETAWDLLKEKVFSNIEL